MLLNQNRAKSILDREELAGILVCNPRNVYYLSNFPVLLECGSCLDIYCLLLNEEPLRPILFFRAEVVDAFYNSDCWAKQYFLYCDPEISDSLGASPEKLSASERELWNFTQNPDKTMNVQDLIMKVIRKEGLSKRRIGIDYSYLPNYKLPNRIQGSFPSIKLVDATNLIREIRWVKTKEEINWMRKAIKANEEGLSAVLSQAKAGMAEKSLAEAFEAGVRKVGGTPHYANIAAGPRTGLPVRYPSIYRIKDGDLLVIDLDCKFGNYFSDIGRTVVIGSASRKVKRVYSGVRAGIEEARDSARPGLKISDLHNKVVQAVRKGGVPQYNRSFTGHCIGLDCREFLVHREEKVILEKRMVLNIEPSYYELGFGGVHLEDTLLVTRDGCESLQEATFDLAEL